MITSSLSSAISSIVVFVIIQLFLDKLSELKSHHNRQCVGNMKALLPQLI